jgi:hypothetical protein
MLGDGDAHSKLSARLGLLAIDHLPSFANDVGLAKVQTHFCGKFGLCILLR